MCLGIDESTFYRRKAELQELQEAIKRGKAKAASEISNKLYLMARGGDLGAIIWYEKTRRGLSDKVSAEITGAVTLKGYAVKEASPDAWDDEQPTE